MNPALIFTYIIYIISVVIYIVAVIISLAFVLPLQIKEAKVRNGLAKLRRQILYKGVVGVVIALGSILALTGRLWLGAEFARYIIVTLVLVTALGTLADKVLDYITYHQQFTPENKALHERFEEVEHEMLEKMRNEK